MKGRGSCIGRAFRRQKRYKEDERYRRKKREINIKYYKKNKKRRFKKQKEWREKLIEFTDKHCKKCGKLLDLKNISGYCRKDWCKTIKPALKHKR